MTYLICVKRNSIRLLHKLSFLHTGGNSLRGQHPENQVKKERSEDKQNQGLATKNSMNKKLPQSLWSSIVLRSLLKERELAYSGWWRQKQSTSDPTQRKLN